MKKVVIAGGSGFLGSQICSKYLQEGWQVIILSRSSKQINLSDAVKQTVNFSNDIEYLKKIINGVDTVINLSGAPLVGKRWTKKYKNEMYESRINTTKTLVEAINKCESKPELFVSTSAIGIYGDRGDTELKESSELGNGFVPNLCKDWEKATENLSSDVRKVIPRVGVVFDADGGALAKLILPYKFHAGGPIGNGKQWISWIHISDLVDFYFNVSIEKKLKGVYNLTTMNSLTINDLSKNIAQKMKSWNIFRVPSFILKLILGEASQVILDSQRVIPENLVNDGYEIKFCSIKSALKDLIK